jgi:hypothetical protein
MKSLATISTTNTRRISLAALLALLALAAIGAGLARELRLIPIRVLAYNSQMWKVGHGL